MTGGRTSIVRCPGLARFHPTDARPVHRVRGSSVNSLAAPRERWASGAGARDFEVAGGRSGRDLVAAARVADDPARVVHPVFPGPNAAARRRPLSRARPHGPRHRPAPRFGRFPGWPGRIRFGVAGKAATRSDRRDAAHLSEVTRRFIAGRPAKFTRPARSTTTSSRASGVSSEFPSWDRSPIKSTKIDPCRRHDPGSTGAAGRTRRDPWPG